MKKCLLLVIALFIFVLSINSVKAVSCRSITSASECNGSSQDGVQCEWVDQTNKDVNTGKAEEKGVCKRPFPEGSSCASFSGNKTDCIIGRTKDGKKFGCAWNSEYEFCSVTGLVYLYCGTGDEVAYDIPKILPKLTSYLILSLKTVTPTILIVIGMLQII